MKKIEIPKALYDRLMKLAKYQGETIEDVVEQMLERSLDSADIR